MVPHPALLDFPHALVKWVTMLLVALVARAYLRHQDTLARIAVAFDASVGTAHVYTTTALAHPDGELLWVSAALAGRIHDLTAARIHISSEPANSRAFPSSPIVPTTGGGTHVTTGLTIT